MREELTDTAPDYFTKFEPHIDRIDFEHPVFKKLVDRPRTNEHYDNCQVAANHISRLLFPERLAYHRDSRFKHANGAFMSPLEVELKILLEHGRDNGAFHTEFDVLPYQHALVALKLMFPDTDITPPLADITYLSLGMFSYDRKMLHLLGSMDAGKSSSTARLAWLFCAIDTYNSFVISGSPLLESAKMTIFGDIIRLGQEIITAHPLPRDSTDKGKLHANKVFPDMTVAKASNKIDLLRGTLTKGGNMAHRSLKTEGMALGSKGESKDKRVGYGLFICDEVNKVEQFDNFLTDLENAARQEWMQLQTTQNPRQETDSGGLLCTPKPWLGWGYESYQQVRDADPTIWPTEYAGLAYRLNGFESVNMRCGRTVYHYLVTKAKIDQTIEVYGRDSPQVMSQVEAMFSGEGDEDTLISNHVVAYSRHNEADYTIIQPKFRVMGVDAAEKGSLDKAVIVTFLVATCVVTYVDGRQDTKDLIIVENPIHYVKFINNFVWEPGHTFWERYVELGGDINSLTLGSPVSYEQQIAMDMAERARYEGIPKRNIIYDPSMRAEVTESVILMMGHEPVAIPLRQKPSGFQLITRNRNTADFATNVNSEALFLAADTVRSKSLRSHGQMKMPLLQLSRRRLAPAVGMKDRQPEKKVDFKARNKGKSPDEGDAFAYAIWHARGLGFVADSPFNPGEKDDNTAFNLIHNNKLDHHKVVSSAPELLD